MKAEKKILQHLLKVYENSKTFKGENKVNQSFTVSIIKIFKEYKNVSDYATFQTVNEAVKELERQGLITVHWYNGEYVDTVSLNIEKLQDIYAVTGITPKAETNEKLRELLLKYVDTCDVLSVYCRKQLQRLQEHKTMEGFKGDLAETEDVLKGVVAVLQVEEETYERDFSVRVYKDSKRFQKLSSKISNILFECGDFPVKETVLQDLNIVKNPGHVYLKGNGSVSFCGQTIELSVVPGDIALSSRVLNSVDSIVAHGQRVITIENLTTFHRFTSEDALVIYLGGYHNTHRRTLLQKVYCINPNAEYLHFGDIDVGGFRILYHLRDKTQMPFKPYCMDIATLEKYQDAWKPLTENDRHGLQSFLEGEFAKVAAYMLENNCKLEQEALD